MRFTGFSLTDDAYETVGLLNHTTPCRRTRATRRLGWERGEKGTWPVAVPLSRRAGRGYRNMLCPIAGQYTASGGYRHPAVSEDDPTGSPHASYVRLSASASDSNSR